MKYFYANALLPADMILRKKINLAAGRLYGKLIKIDLKDLNVSEYNRKYFGNKLNNLESVLQLYSYHLLWGLFLANLDLQDCTCVDYGGGCGILSLLAKELGIGTVVYNDIYDVSCQDAQCIASSVHLDADHYVCGDISELSNYVRAKRLEVCTIVSYDVIEHIYNLNDFISKLPGIPNKSLSIVFGSGANAHNYLTRRRLMKKQIQCEFFDRQRVWGHKERDSLRSYFDIRRDILTALAPELSSAEVRRMATLTRGLMRDDIAKVLEEYRSTGRIFYGPDHPTNTCDPYTGNWAERLMKVGDIKDMVTRAGFKARILNGYYGSGRGLIRNLRNNLLNVLISSFRDEGLRIAPYFMVYAKLA